MLEITSAQMKRFEADAAIAHVVELSDFVAEQFASELPLDDRGRLEAEVGRVRDQALHWGFEPDREVRAVLIIRFTFGATFADLPWLRAIIDDPFGRKLDRLIEAAARRAP